MIASILSWLAGGPSPVTVDRMEREERRRKLEVVMQRFEETHERLGEACAGVVEAAGETRAKIAEACAATRSCAAVQAQADAESSGGMP